METEQKPISINTVPDSSVVQPEQLGIGILFWTIRDAAVVADASTGRILFWNPSAQHLFGWSAAEIVGAPIERLIPERLRSAHRAGLMRYLETGTGPIIDGHSPVEVPAIRSDGAEITVELSLTPLVVQTAPAGDRRYVLALFRDASERTRLAAERESLLTAAQEYAGRLEELATLKIGFTQMVAHELGTPVGAIRALVDLMRRGAVSGEEQSALLSAIRKECDLIGRLIADVATAAAIERDDFTIHPRPVPAAALLADAVAFGHAFTADHVIQEEIDPAVVATLVHVDPERIGQVIRNLLGNAVKHTPPGSTVTLRARREDTCIGIEVADNGPGIPNHDLDRIFTKFGRGRGAEDRHTPGVGLGLFVARQILRAHGSDLNATSVVGRGTIFAFALEVVS